MRIFLDANILFSAAASDGAIRRLVNTLLDLRHECWADEFVLTEATRNLAAKSPEALPWLETLLKRIRIAPGHAPGPELTLVQWLPEKDRPVLAAAIRLRCDILVTGDRTHFGVAYGKKFAGVTVQSPRMLAEQVLMRH